MTPHLPGPEWLAVLAAACFLAGYAAVLLAVS